MTRICITPFVEQTGGMTSFRLKFEQGLKTRNIEVTYDLDDKFDAVLVIAGTRFIRDLNRIRKRGIRVVQRLDGVNWVHRVKWSGVRYTVRAVYGNTVLALIRNRFTDRVIYQSHFIRKWWEDWYGVAKSSANVIHNGIDLNAYTQNGDHARSINTFQMLLLEANLTDGLNSGLFHAVSVAEKLAEKYPMKVVVAGNVDEAARKKILSMTASKKDLEVDFLGTIPHAEIPRLARSSHLMFCAEVNPPCPNSVIEALACGLPVIGFDTGSLKELVSEEAGIIVPYGANPWKLEMPDVNSLAASAESVLENQDSFRAAARSRAEEKFGLDKMVEAYLSVLLGGG